MFKIHVILFLDMLQVWMLREIISDLEVQVSNKSEREATLEQRLDELETELEKQNRAQEDMLQEVSVLFIIFFYRKYCVFMLQ